MTDISLWPINVLQSADIKIISTWFVWNNGRVILIEWDHPMERLVFSLLTQHLKHPFSVLQTPPVVSTHLDIIQLL